MTIDALASPMFISSEQSGGWGQVRIACGGEHRALRYIKKNNLHFPSAKLSHDNCYCAYSHISEHNRHDSLYSLWQLLPTSSYILFSWQGRDNYRVTSTLITLTTFPRYIRIEFLIKINICSLRSSLIFDTLVSTAWILQHHCSACQHFQQLVLKNYLRRKGRPT